MVGGCVCRVFRRFVAGRDARNCDEKRGEEDGWFCVQVCFSVRVQLAVGGGFSILVVWSGEDNPKAAATDAIFGGVRSLAEVNWLRAIDSLKQGCQEPPGPRQRITLDLSWLNTMYKSPD